MDISYRPVRKEDGFEWYTLLSRVWRTAYGHILPEEAFVEREKAVPAKAREFTLEKFSGDRKIAYVAEHGGKIVGLMYGTLDSDYGFFKDEYADLVALYVYPEYQGMGVGTALKGIFERWAREKNEERRKHYAEHLVYQVTVIAKNAGYIPMLYTDADYAASNACYEKIGYVLRGKLCTIG